MPQLLYISDPCARARCTPLNPSMPDVRLRIGFLDNDADAAPTHLVRMANIELSPHTTPPPTLNYITAIGFLR